MDNILICCSGPEQHKLSSVSVAEALTKYGIEVADLDMVYQVETKYCRDCRTNGTAYHDKVAEIYKPDAFVTLHNVVYRNNALTTYNGSFQAKVSQCQKCTDGSMLVTAIVKGARYMESVPASSFEKVASDHLRLIKLADGTLAVRIVFANGALEVPNVFRGTRCNKYCPSEDCPKHTIYQAKKIRL